VSGLSARLGDPVLVGFGGLDPLTGRRFSSASGGTFMDASVEASTVSSIVPSVEFIMSDECEFEEKLHRVMTC
jgi:hypothetical protein